MNPAKQERTPDYVMRHAPERIASIPNILYRQEKKRTPDLRDHTENLKEDQVDVLLLRLMSLATQYLLTPKSERALQRELGNVAILQDLQGKSGEDLLEAFEKLELKTHTATPQRAGELRESDASALESLAAIRVGLRERMLDILRHSVVREKYEKILKDEALVKKTAKTPLGAISRLENIRKHSKQQLRALRAGEILSSEIRPGGKRGRKTPGIAPEVAKNLSAVVLTAQAEKEKKEAVLTDEARGLYKMQQLLDYKEQLDTTGFAMTPSREVLMDEISDLAAQGFRVFLGGPTGTGKTNLGLFALKELTDGEYEVISWTGETGIRDLFGAPKIIATDKGMETTMQKGGYTKAVIGEKSGVLQEEITTGRTGVQISLKALWAARSGEAISIAGFNGHEFTKEQLIEIATGNLRGRRHEEREEMDPAIAREFKALEVPFMPAEEMRDIIFAQNAELAGFVGISKVDMKMIDSLCKAAELSQLVYLEKLSVDIKNQAFYSLISPTKDDIHLTKVFLDTGTTQDLFASWQTAGKSLSEFLREQLQRFIFNNPHFSELESERTNMVNILKAYGFDFDEGEGHVFYAADSTKQDWNTPYVLPSELGFLIESPKRSNDDDIATPETKPKEEGGWKNKKHEGKTYRYQERSFTNSSGVIFEPGIVYTMEVGTKKIRMKFYGVLDDANPLTLPNWESGRTQVPKGLLEKRIWKIQNPPDDLFSGLPSSVQLPPPEGSRVEGTDRILFSSDEEVVNKVDSIFSDLFIPLDASGFIDGGKIVWPRLVAKLAERPLTDAEGFVNELFKDFPNAEELTKFINRLWTEQDFFGYNLAEERQLGRLESQSELDTKIYKHFLNFRTMFEAGTKQKLPTGNIVIKSFDELPPEGRLVSNDFFGSYDRLLVNSSIKSSGVIAMSLINAFIDSLITSVHKLPVEAARPFAYEGIHITGRENLPPAMMQDTSLYSELFKIANWGGLYLGIYDKGGKMLVGDVQHCLYIPELPEVEEPERQS